MQVRTRTSVVLNDDLKSSHSCHIQHARLRSQGKRKDYREGDFSAKF